jgi:hypothetical protein
MSLKENLIIEIRPIPGRDGIRKFSENLEYFSGSHTISAFVDPVTRKFATGLSEEDIAYLKDNNFPYDIDNNYTGKEPHPFWESQLIKTDLKNGPIFLYPSKSLIDFIKYKYLLVNDYIYKSEKELESGSKSEATHYIYNESEELATKATTLNKKNNLLAKVNDLSPQRKRDLILIILNEVTENKDENYLVVRFDDILNNKDNSKQLETLLNRKEEETTLAAEIKLAIQKNVLQRTKQGIFYFENNLGYGEEDVFTFLNKKENQEILINIKEKLQ